MARTTHDTMMNPPIEKLLGQVDSKFRLVTLAARRARQINSYFNHLGDSLGADGAAAGHLGRPQAAVDRASRRSPPTRSIRPDRPETASSVELAVVEVDDGRRGRPPRARPASSPCRHSPGGASCSASPAGSPPTRPSRCAAGSSTPAPTSCPVMTEGRGALRRAAPRCRALASEPVRDLARGTTPTPSRTPGSARAPTSWSWRRPPPGCSAPTPPASPATCSPPRCWPPGRRWSSARRCTPRCGSTRPCRTTWPRCGAGACYVVEPEAGRLAGGDVGRRPAGRARGASSPPPSGPSAARDLAGLHVVVTAGGTREAIDAVRVITNRSSGKQGYAVAAEAAARGADGHARHHRRARPPRRASSGVDVETRGRDARPPSRRLAERPTWWSWPRPWPTSARRRPPTGKLKKDAGPPEIDPRADRRHPRRARARPSGRARSLVGFAAETDDLVANAAAQAAAQAPRPHRGQRRVGARRRLRARHQRRHHPVGRRAACERCPARRQAGRRPRRARRRRRRRPAARSA